MRDVRVVNETVFEEDFIVSGEEVFYDFNLNLFVILCSQNETFVDISCRFEAKNGKDNN